MAGDWRIGVSEVLKRVLMLVENDESSGDVLEALQASSESLRTRLAVAGATEKATEFRGPARDLAQTGCNRRQRLIGKLKSQQRLPLVFFKGNAARSRSVTARQLLEMLDS